MGRRGAVLLALPVPEDRVNPPHASSRVPGIRWGEREAMKLSLVVPCYNEQAVIQETHGRLVALGERWRTAGLIDDLEIIYVDDGSRDRTLELLQQLADSDRRVKVLGFSRNFGHQAALTAGLDHASGAAAVTLDADLQDPPETVEQMLESFRAGSEVVFGVRKSRREDTWFKRSTALAFYRLMRLMGVELLENHADFRLLSRPALEQLKRYHEVNRFLRGLIPTLGFRQAVVYYERQKRFAGESKYPIWKMLRFALEGITSFTAFPLRIAAILGFLVFTGAACCSIWALAVKLSGAVVPGWTSTVLPIYLLGGVQMLLIGVVGEYLGKIYLEVKARPLYIVRERINFDPVVAATADIADHETSGLTRKARPSI